MPEKPEVVPPTAHIEAVKEQVISDVLRQLNTESGHGLAVEISVWKDGERVERLGEETVGSNPWKGEVRLRFRSTYQPNRFLFFADSVLQGDPEFSGFSVRGDVRATPEGPQASFSSWVLKRHDSKWMKWL
jgi:hypothetical protein